jgi:hypothetical protein
MPVNNTSGVFLFRKEGVTQGDPLSMCSLLWRRRQPILPLICILLKQEFPEVEQPRYANDTGELDVIRRLFLKLQEIKLAPATGISRNHRRVSSLCLVVRTALLETARSAFTDLKFKVVTGNHYLGISLARDRHWTLRSKKRPKTGQKPSRSLPWWPKTSLKA